MTGNKIPKNEAAKSFFSTAMLQIRKDQRTDAISETTVDMKTNLLGKEQSCKKARKTIKHS